MQSKQEEQLEVIKEYLQCYQKEFYRLAYSYTKNSEDALDIVQEAVYKAIRNSHKLKNIEHIKTWMYRILVNESINLIRKRKRTAFAEPDLMNIPYEDKDITQSITLYNAIQQLEPNQKIAIILRFFEDMKLDEIAYITQSNLSTVKSRLYKSLDILRKIIGSDENE